MTTIANIDAIGRIADKLRELELIEPPVKHHFSKGVYVREIFMAAGVRIVGKIHKTRHLNIVSTGKCKVITPLRILDIDATVVPFTFESYEGEQKVVVMHEDTVWSTVHITEETDLKIIEEQCIATEFDEELIAKLGSVICLGDL